jgi:hypothetical protein
MYINVGMQERGEGGSFLQTTKHFLKKFWNAEID